MCILKLSCKHHDDGTLHYAWVKTTIQWYLLPGFGKFISIYLSIYLMGTIPNWKYLSHSALFLQGPATCLQRSHFKMVLSQVFLYGRAHNIFFLSLRLFICWSPATIIFMQRMCDLRKSWKDPMPFWLSLELLFYGNLIMALY